MYDAMIVCRKCENGASYRPDLRAIFNAQPAGLHTRRSLFDQLVAGGACCNNCCSPNDLSMPLYHLRQDGLVELFARGMFRRRLSDATTTDFIYAGRERVGP